MAFLLVSVCCDTAWVKAGNLFTTEMNQKKNKTNKTKHTHTKKGGGGGGGRWQDNTDVGDCLIYTTQLWVIEFISTLSDLSEQEFCLTRSLLCPPFLPLS